MAKKGQSKYMKHLRVTKSIASNMQVLGKAGRGSVLEQHDAMYEKAKTNAAKGKRGGDCNRTQCQRPNAWWYNKTMQAYYCADCAGAINESCLFKDHIVSFGSMVYVMPPVIRKDDHLNGGHALVITTADGTWHVQYCQEAADEDAAADAFKKACRMTGLRPDGTPPFHYSELRDKMLKMRERIQEAYPMLEMVEFV